MLDTRQYDRDITNLYYNEEIIDMADDKDRSMTGPKQEKWMFNELKKSKKRGATWQLLGQQMVFSAVKCVRMAAVAYVYLPGPLLQLLSRHGWLDWCARILSTA